MTTTAPIPTRPAMTGISYWVDEITRQRDDAQRAEVRLRRKLERAEAENRHLLSLLWMVDAQQHVCQSGCGKTITDELRRRSERGDER